MGASPPPDSDKDISSTHTLSLFEAKEHDASRLGQLVREDGTVSTTASGEGQEGGVAQSAAAALSSTSTSTAPTTAAPVTTTTTTASTAISPTTSKPGTASTGQDTKRKRHVKSRTGCYNCKKRKVKCNEHWPECYNCKRLRMVCEYPWAPPPVKQRRTTADLSDGGGGGGDPQPHHQHHHGHQCCCSGSHHQHDESRASSSAGSGSLINGYHREESVGSYLGSGGGLGDPSAPLRTTPTVLTMEDLKFFHQFMTVGFPSFRSRSVWEQCAAMSSHYECLAHSVLALGASHLTQTSNGQADYTVQALRHRLAAIKLINHKLSEPAPLAAGDDVDGGDALFASCVCLISQSSLMPDGLLDSLMLYRGLAVLGETVLRDQQRSRFGVKQDPRSEEAASRGSTPAAKRSGTVGSSTDKEKEYETGDTAGFKQEEKLQDSPGHDDDDDMQRIEEAQASLAVLRPFCTGVAEQQVFESLWGITQVLKDGMPVDTWAPMAAVQRALCTVPSPSFAAFVNMHNHASQLLVAHAFLVDWFLRYDRMDEAERLRQLAWQKVILAWIQRVLDGLPWVFQPAGAWPRRYAGVLAAEGFTMVTGEKKILGQQQQQQQQQRIDGSEASSRPLAREVDIQHVPGTPI